MSIEQKSFSVSNEAEKSQSSTSMFNAHQEYLNGNIRKSLRLVVNAKELVRPPAHDETLDGSDVIFASIFNNALGCNYAKLNKFHLAMSYFEKALNENRKYFGMISEMGIISLMGKSKNKKAASKNLSLLRNRCQENYWAILHNYALALLQAGFADKAFECFLQLIKVYPRNPRMWLRLAECCVVIKQKNNIDEFNVDERRHECIRGIVGVGPHRKIVLNTMTSNIKGTRTLEQTATSTIPTYEFAYLCLKNALFSLPKITQEHLRNIAESDAMPSSSSDTDVLLWPMPPETPMSVKQLYRLKCSMLCAVCYVCLCVHEYYGVEEAAKELLAMEYISPLHRFLGRLYAAEALIRLNRLQDAVGPLSLDPVNDLTITEFTSGNEGLPPSDWYPKTTKAATMVLLYNVGVFCGLKGDWIKANEITKLVQATINDNGDCPVAAISQMLHEFLWKGQFGNARTIVSQFFPDLQISE